MNHLKLYESYLDEYYIHISHEYASKLIGDFVVDGGRLVNENLLEFNDRELNRIKSIYSDIKKPNFRNVIDFTIDESGKLIIRLYHLGIFGKRKMIEYQFIYKLNDDWFILKHNNLYGWFKCDQFEGLMKCMEDHKMKFPPTDLLTFK